MNLLGSLTVQLQQVFFHFIRLLLMSHFPFVPHQFETNETPQSTYDFIVVGSGPGGSVVASRLSETDASVLLLEKGSSAPPESAVPAISFAVMQKDAWLRFIAEPNKAATLAFQNNSAAYFVGSAMGGTSSINSMVYLRGAKQDYDHWVRLGNQGWDYESVLPYFMKLENFKGYRTPGAEGRHQLGGLLTIESRKMNSTVHRTFLAASEELQLRVHDGTGPILTGIVPLYAASKDGVRASASEAFLKPVIDRPNLTIRSRANVIKVLFNKHKRATGVAYVFKGKVHIVRARKEVILSAGALATPKLLMLSGIGPREQLEKFRIRQVSALEGVGKNLDNHYNVDHIFRVRDDLPLSIYDTINPSTIKQYITRREGPLSGSLALECHAFLKLGDDEPDWPDVGVTSWSFSPATAGELFYTINNINEEMSEEYYGQFEGAKTITLATHLLRPKSRGEITLRSADPNDFAVVNFNMFDHPDDIKLLVKSAKKVHEIANSRTFKELLGTTTNNKHIAPCRHHPAHSDAYWECHIRHYATAGAHYAGTVKMAPDTDSMGVVNNRLSVRGVSGLRVVDASIMPQISCTNTMATTYMIAEKASDMIKEDWGYALDPLPVAQVCPNDAILC